MLRETVYYKRKKIPLSFSLSWLKGIAFISFLALLIMGVAYSMENGAAKQFVSALSEWHFPMEVILMEGDPGLSAPERDYLEEIRKQGLATAMFLMTGVNITDARTFFLGYYSSSPEGPQWLAWAYNPKDPEFEGAILEPIGSENSASTAQSGSSGTPGTENNQSTPAGNSTQSDNVASPPKVGDVLVGIYHTHNSERYCGDGGPDRETGKNSDVVTVGDTLAKTLSDDGIGVVHSKVIHDAVDFMKAYSSSIITATKMMKDYPSIEVLLDIHRDGFPAGVDKVTVNIDGQKASQVKIVIGQENPHWKVNDAMARELIAIGNEEYPGLFAKNITYASDARYNQHLSNGAILLEFGSQLNTLAESNRAAEAAGKVIEKWLKEH